MRERPHQRSGFDRRRRSRRRPGSPGPQGSRQKQKEGDHSGSDAGGQSAPECASVSNLATNWGRRGAWKVREIGHPVNPGRRTINTLLSDPLTRMKATAKLTVRVYEQRRRSSMPTDEQLTLLALCRIRDLDWHFLAREAQRGGGLARLLAVETTESSSEAEQAAHRLRVHLPSLGTPRRATSTTRPSSSIEPGACTCSVATRQLMPAGRRSGLIISLPTTLAESSIDSAALQDSRQ